MSEFNDPTKLDRLLGDPTIKDMVDELNALISKQKAHQVVYDETKLELNENSKKIDELKDALRKKIGDTLGVDLEKKFGGWF